MQDCTIESRRHCKGSNRNALLFAGAKLGGSKCRDNDNNSDNDNDNGNNGNDEEDNNAKPPSIDGHPLSTGNKTPWSPAEKASNQPNAKLPSPTFRQYY